MPIRVGIAATPGLAGEALLRLLLAHPNTEIAAIAADNAAGRRADQVWPGFASDHPVEPIDPPSLARRCDAVFLALPSGAAARLVPALLDGGTRVFDLGPDFRLRDAAVYAGTYGVAHPCPQHLAHAVYGLPEKHRDALPNARLVAVPGGSPTATALAALPLAEEGLADGLVADCLSSASGGRPDLSEISQTLGEPVAFTPHLVPMIRGMVATVHGHLRHPLTNDGLRALYAARYAGHPLVVLRDTPPSTAEVRGSSRAHVHVAMDAARGLVTAVCVTDPSVRSASGQAVQCFNLAFGLTETLGLA